MSNRLFDFVRQFSNELADLAQSIEDQLFENPHGTLMQTRLYAEELVKIISQKEGLEKIYPLKPAERIHKLYRQDLIEEEIYTKLEWIRRTGNKAVHDVKKAEIKDVLEAHKLLFEISVWYMQVYVNFDFEVPEYQLPVKTSQEGTLIALEDLDERIREEVKRQIEVIREESMKVHQRLEAKAVQNSAVLEKAPEKMVKISESKKSFCDILEKNDYIITNETPKAVEFEHTISKQIIYMAPNKKETSIVLDPNFVNKHETLKSNGVRRSSTAYRKFPKDLNKGKTPINFGYMYTFNSEAEFDLFLKSINIFQSN
ncbi:DUF4145 domain-containing protein [Neobacillus mesonae]|uniref:DUF4145 domain-containing protein n=1 Tax=Neobacillus mesonae TaxID=1193713 RepID=UPI00203B4954|nr:DUF4145 domain-containing protein [Neobacillus mesonae]MCM3570309.1 DUF4145 domain-containing protein [Neobacillus mesonae]